MVILFSCSIGVHKANVVTTNNDGVTAINPFGLRYYDALKVDAIFDTTSCLSVAQFFPLYIGALRDSIFLNHGSHLPQRREAEKDELIRLPGNDIEITVDTTQFITSVEYRGRWVSVENNYEMKRKSEEVYLKSYPVILKNNRNKTTTVGYGNHLPIIMEAKDSLGEWNPIQVGYTYLSSTELLFPFLKKDEYLITACKLFEGEFKTTLRLKYGWVAYTYSNEFSGQISYSQFTRCN